MREDIQLAVLPSLFGLWKPVDDAGGAGIDKIAH